VTKSVQRFSKICNVVACHNVQRMISLEVGSRRIYNALNYRSIRVSGSGSTWRMNSCAVIGLNEPQIQPNYRMLNTEHQFEHT